MQWIIQAFGERYGARAHATSSKPREHSPVQVTEEEVHYQLALLPVRKAVPPEAAPAALWRACVAETSPFIAREVNQQWREPELQIRQDWADANVALLPKVKARTDSPLDWRPIGLQNPVGKTLMKILVARAKDQIHQLVMQYPQTAYVPHRSTHTALKRVYQHCARVRRCCQKQRTTIDEKSLGLQRSTNYGGLQISMDLSAAFDLVPWGAVKEALELAQVDVHPGSHVTMALASQVHLSTQATTGRHLALLGPATRMYGKSCSLVGLHSSPLQSFRYEAAPYMEPRSCYLVC